MPTFDWLRNAFTYGYSSGDIASPLPNWRRWREERRIGGSYRQVLAKGILPYVRQNSVVLEIGPGRGSWTRALLKSVPTCMIHVVDFRNVAQWLEPESGDRLQSLGHSAHIGQEVEVHYRWHPLYGRRVKLHGSEQRNTGRIVYVEATPGVVTVIAAWMLDPISCAGMEIGAPRAAVLSLLELQLHHLLIECGFRRSSRDDSSIVQEEHYEEPAGTGAAADSAAPAQHGARFRKPSGDEPIRSPHGTCAAGHPLDGSRGRRGGGAQR